ncbi:bifunctional diaminohydroxyphosphoribosylaminopyrimidine deaminase/5-amino-6-(5-phosphoribosylamino)uracil reductase RibD [Deinococcus sp. PESE-13]
MNTEHPPDAEYMQLALNEAAKGLGRTSPNPPVGCVIVRDGEIVGRGFHPRAGEPHAEVFALRGAGERARGATAYVTLEPCSHHGRTPPCADALISAGVSRVVVAAGDPNPQVNGRGLDRLRAAGIPTETGVLEAEAVRQQAGFRSLVTRGRPHVIYKYAMTLDGKVAALNEGNGPVSGPGARARVMAWRNEVDAVAVGARTALLDDPQLNVRGLDGGRDPRAVLFDPEGHLPASARAVREGTVLVLREGRTTPLERDPRVTVLHAHSLQGALEQLAGLGVATLLLEGGPTLASAFFEAGLIDELRVFVAPKLLGAGLSPLLAPVRSMHAAAGLAVRSVEVLGNDVLVIAERRGQSAES